MPSASLGTMYLFLRREKIYIAIQDFVDISYCERISYVHQDNNIMQGSDYKTIM